jgi:hypothetical protein
MDVLIDEANNALAARGYAPHEAAVSADEARGPDWGVLRGSLVRETFDRKGNLLLLVSQFPLRDDLVAARAAD